MDNNNIMESLHHYVQMKGISQMELKSYKKNKVRSDNK